MEATVPGTGTHDTTNPTVSVGRGPGGSTASKQSPPVASTITTIATYAGSVYEFGTPSPGMHDRSGVVPKNLEETGEAERF